MPCWAEGCSVILRRASCWSQSRKGREKNREDRDFLGARCHQMQRSARPTRTLGFMFRPSVISCSTVVVLLTVLNLDGCTLSGQTNPLVNPYLQRIDAKRKGLG